MPESQTTGKEKELDHDKNTDEEPVKHVDDRNSPGEIFRKEDEEKTNHESPNNFQTASLDW